MLKQENNLSDTINERCYAVLLGCAIGDALGMPVEGWKKEQIRKYVGKIEHYLDPVVPTDATGREVQRDEFGPLKCWNRDITKGCYTDDTILTLALAQSLAQYGMNLEEIAKGQLQEYLDRLLPNGDVFGGFGGTTKAAFQNLINGMSPTDSGVIGGPGNAPAMKMAPLGVYMHLHEKYADGLKFAKTIGEITHKDPRSVASGVVHAHAIYSLLHNIDRHEFVDTLDFVCRNYEDPLTHEFTDSLDGPLASRFAWISMHRDAAADFAHKNLKSTSKVYHSYPFAVFMFQKYWDDPIAGLIETVNYGGDCDTTGAMYGAMVGARFGNIFPREWIDGLVGKEKILEVAKKLSGI